MQYTFISRSVLFIFLLATSLITAQAQTSAAATDSLKGWHLADAGNGFQGISINKAYEWLKSNKKKSTQVIVAVIDSGIDTLHEDLKPILWKNPGEIPGNGMDDDKNGYIDDVHGWNFLGNANGGNVEKDSYEAARVYHGLREKWEGKKVDRETLSADDRYEYDVEAGKRRDRQQRQWHASIDDEEGLSKLCQKRQPLENCPRQGNIYR
jgi:hypothetical protein